MTHTVEVDEITFRALELAARMAATTPGGIVARLVEAASAPAERPEVPTDVPDITTAVAVHADYQGHRTHGSYDPTTRSVGITSGPLAPKRYTTPTGAARAVVGHYNPKVHNNRNGWDFWLIDDTGETLQSIR